MVEQCPCCLRAFERLQDFPRVLVHRVERLPAPEYIDHLSEEAARLQVRLIWRGQKDPDQLLAAGINRTPEIAAAYESEEVQGYLSLLESLVGQEVSPESLAPPWAPHHRFRGAYPVSGTQLFLFLMEGDLSGDERVCRVVFLGGGTRLGSAGGSAFQDYGPIAVIRYEGRLFQPAVGSNVDQE
jgi:hypothetical protein